MGVSDAYNSIRTGNVLHFAITYVENLTQSTVLKTDDLGFEEIINIAIPTGIVDGDTSLLSYIVDIKIILICLHPSDAEEPYFLTTNTLQHLQ